MDEREKRDAEINKALEQAQRLIQGSDIPTQVQNHEDDIDDIINMVKVNFINFNKKIIGIEKKIIHQFIKNDRKHVFKQKSCV